MNDVNVFIAFSKKETALAIAKMVISSGYRVASVSTNIVDTIHNVSYYKDGVIICDCGKNGAYLKEAIYDLSDSFSVVVIGNREQLAGYSGDRIFKLAVPLKKNDLMCSLDMLSTVESSYMPTINSKNDDERKMIDRAKRVLIDVYSMTESQAHRYMQKKSMDTGMNRKINRAHEVWLSMKLKVLIVNRKDKSDGLLAKPQIKVVNLF